MLKSAPFPLCFFPSHFADRARVSYGKNKTAEGTQTHCSAIKPGFCLSGGVCGACGESTGEPADDDGGRSDLGCLSVSASLPSAPPGHQMPHVARSR